MDADFKNALPNEVDDHPDSGMPRQLRSQGDDREPLTERQASAAGMGVGADVVYGDSDEDPNRDDQADMHAGATPEGD